MASFDRREELELTDEHLQNEPLAAEAFFAEENDDYAAMADPTIDKAARDGDDSYAESNIESNIESEVELDDETDADLDQQFDPDLDTDLDLSLIHI